MRIHHNIKALLLKLIICSSLVAVGMLLPQAAAQKGAATAQKGQQPAPASRPGFPNLVEGLTQSPGCLGIEQAQTRSGKNVIFAWFESKQAAMDWYYSDTHQSLMKQFFPGNTQREPMQDIPDDIGPVLAVASITYANAAQLKETKLPISQIAIELYKPLNGGLFLGGRFAPKEMKVPGLKDYTPRK